MPEKAKIGIGLVLFIVLILVPLFYNLATGQGDYKPELDYPKNSKNCIEDTEFMRHDHMNMLNSWRDEYVREQNRVYTAKDGKKYLKSLTNTCLKCHTSKKNFCDKCHEYTGVDPYCWDCHVSPEEVNRGQ